MIKQNMIHRISVFGSIKSNMSPKKLTEIAVKNHQLIRL
jgi:hypothetical protein